MNETSEQIETQIIEISKECSNFLAPLKSELEQAEKRGLAKEHIEQLREKIKRAETSDNITLASLNVRLIEAKKRENKATAEKEAEIERRSASDKAIMKAQMQGAWFREGGDLAGFQAAWEELYKAEIMKRTLARVAGDERKGIRSIRNIFGGV